MRKVCAGMRNFAGVCCALVLAWSVADAAERFSGRHAPTPASTVLDETHSHGEEHAVWDDEDGVVIATDGPLVSEASVYGREHYGACGEECDGCGNGCGNCGRCPCRCMLLNRMFRIRRFDVSWDNCNCGGSYKYPVPPLYTYHWPGIYSQQRMTDYRSPWRFPPLKRYTDESPYDSVPLAAGEVPTSATRPAAATTRLD